MEKLFLCNLAGLDSAKAQLLILLLKSKNFLKKSFFRTPPDVPELIR